MWINTLLILLSTISVAQLSQRRTRQSEPSTSLQCELPACPDYGIYEAQTKIDELGRTTVTISTKCHDGYKPETKKHRRKCVNGKWDNDPPKCIRGSSGQSKKESDCIVPSCNHHGKLVIVDYGTLLREDTYSKFTLTIECDEGYTVTSNERVKCDKGEWDGHVPRCSPIMTNPNELVIKTKDIPNDKLDISVYQDGKIKCKFPNDTPGTMFTPVVPYDAVAGDVYDPTLVFDITCREGYKLKDSLIGTNEGPKQFTCDQNNLITSVCVEIDCGIITDKQRELGIIPWHVEIYNTDVTPNVHICGGSLISTTIVITAAHCLIYYYEDDKWRKKDKDSFAVMVNNGFQGSTAPKSKVGTMYFPDEFVGPKTNYYVDVAILILNTPAAFNEYVGSVCLGLDKDLYNRQVRKGSNGTVALIDNVTNRPTATVLEYFDSDECKKSTQPDKELNLPCDKICCGDGKEMRVVSSRNSGAGLAFPYQIGNKIKYYLQGTGFYLPGKESQKWETFTKISQHKSFILKNMKQENDYF